MSDPSRSSTAAEWTTRDADVVWHGFTQMSVYAQNEPVIVDHAVGHHLVDVDGKRYLDAISSLWVNTMGHVEPELTAAAHAQLDRVAHSTMLGNGNRATIEFAERLAEIVPVEQAHILFASDGAAAVEQALKIAFQFWFNQGIHSRTSYLALGDAYHGDTVGSLALGAGGFGTELFDTLRFPVSRTPGYADPDWAEKAVRALTEYGDSLAAVILEPLVQGASGILVAEPADVRQFVETAQGFGIPVICDEVATGFGRTGAMFASEICAIRPDIMVLGKGIAAGYIPLSATVVANRVYETFLGEDLGERTFYHGHSFSGHALGCAVGLRHLELFVERDILSNVALSADHLTRRLDKDIAPLGPVAAVRQQGLMVGVELRATGDGSLTAGLAARRVCAEAVRRGVLLRPLGAVVVIMTPLSFDTTELDEVVDTLADSIAAVFETESA
ncbi:MAG: aminotransferase class III-fold pyridoxal phosphate-dependent enzyme [Acidobacteria bacterium]|nr:aminotransferase class III-fold pyridoxal phosphate-dependent enzyme [Acidobacteriota bacterium]